MNTQCEKCERYYDDAKCWTICPHGPLWAGLHDYCPRCDTVKIAHGPCQHQIEGTATVPRKETMNEITSHKVNGLNESLRIGVLDEPGQGNACHEYQIVRDTHGNGDEYDQVELCNVQFQNGPVLEAGVNGVSNESLLAIVEHRLQGFQSGDFACRENAVALTKLQECMMWLQKRTRDRMARGVEGTNQK